MLFNTTQGYDSVNKRITSSQLRFMIRAVCVYHLLTTTADAVLKEKRKMNLTSNIISCNGFLDILQCSFTLFLVTAISFHEFWQIIWNLLSNMVICMIIELCYIIMHDDYKQSQTSDLKIHSIKNIPFVNLTNHIQKRYALLNEISEKILFRKILQMKSG